MRILIFADHYLPGFRAGGPIRTLANLVDRLGHEFQFRIVAKDRDLGDVSMYPGVKTGVWTRGAGAEIFYLGHGPAGLAQTRQLLIAGDYDLLYLNSALSPPRTLWPLLLRRLRLAPRRPCLIAPRGEFAAGALATKSLKKQVFLKTVRLLGLYDDVAWQTSSAHDAVDLRRRVDVPEQRLFVVPNLPRQGSLVPSSVRSASIGLRVVFLGRVAPIKNLDYALDVLGRVRTPVRFEIHGPIENAEYWSGCKAQIEKLPAHIQVVYMGVAPSDRVSAILAAHDLLFLPTQGENFGHAIAESLQAGTSVLISDQTPWRGLVSAGAGWDLALSEPQAFATAIETLATDTAERRDRRRRAAQAFAETELDAPAIEARTRAMFRAAANLGVEHSGRNGHGQPIGGQR